MFARAFLILFLSLFLFSCSSGSDRNYQVKLLDLTRASHLKGLLDQDVDISALSDNCIITSYFLKGTDANGDTIFSKESEIVPDLSKVNTESGTPNLSDLVSAFNFNDTFTITNPQSNPSYNSVTLSFKGITKLCNELWGGTGKFSTVSTVFYGSTTVNLNSLPEATGSCAGLTNCISMDSYISALYAIRMTDALSTFLSTTDLKRFVPVIFHHTNTNCHDDASATANRNSISVKTSIEGLDSVTSTFSASDDDKYYFVPDSAIEESSEDAIKTIVLVSLIVGETYEITFTQGTGTGCTSGLSKTMTLKFEENQIFDSAGNRSVRTADVDVNWTE